MEIFLNPVNSIEHLMIVLKKQEVKKRILSVVPNLKKREEIWKMLEVRWCCLCNCSTPICEVMVLQGTIPILSKCVTSHIIFIYLFIAPLWTRTVPFVKTYVILYSPYFL